MPASTPTAADLPAPSSQQGDLTRQVPGEPPRAPHLLAGARAEQAAAAFLEDQGLTVLAHNVRTRRGEIDLIALDQGTLVFCEVRWRRDGRFGGALGSVDGRKQMRMRRAAQEWLSANADRCPARLDLLCAEGPPPWSWLWLRGV